MTIYLYKKTHTITGLKYLGKTVRKDPHKYTGSGTRWLNHLRKHGFSYTTEILRECETKQEAREWGLFYSNLWNVVDNPEWANIIPEQCDGCTLTGEKNGMFGRNHSESSRKKISQQKLGQFKGQTYEQIYGEEKAFDLKKQRSESAKNKDNSFKNNPRFDGNEYTFFNLKTGEMLVCSRFVFIQTKNINKGGTSEMINKGIIYKDWCVLYT